MVPEILHIFEGPSEIWIDPQSIWLVGQTSGSVRIRGDLYVDGNRSLLLTVDKIETW